MIQPKLIRPQPAHDQFMSEHPLSYQNHYHHHHHQKKKKNLRKKKLRKKAWNAERQSEFEEGEKEPLNFH